MPRSTPGNPVEYAMFLFFVFLALLVWAVLGLAIWTFVLVRMTVVISVLALWSGLTGRHDPTMGEYILSSVEFYPRGFRRIYDNALSSTGTAPARYVSVWRAAVDSMFSLAFWFGVAAIYRTSAWHAVADRIRDFWHAHG